MHAASNFLDSAHDRHGACTLSVYASVVRGRERKPLSRRRSTRRRRNLQIPGGGSTGQHIDWGTSSAAFSRADAHGK